MFDDETPMHGDAITEIAKNDGLTLEEFSNFFVPNVDDTWEGRLIHWTSLKY